MTLLPSLNQQLRSEREASDSKFVVSHIDTCLSSYLNDHHNRDGELLLGVFVDGASTVGQVLDALRDEYRQIGYEIGSNRLGFDYDAGLAAIEALIDENARVAHKPFDLSLDGPPSEEDEKFFDEDDNFDEEAFEAAVAEYERELEMSESCQAWFLIHWDVPEEGGDVSD